MNDLERLEGELRKQEIAKAKAESIIEQTQVSWKKEFETDDVAEIIKIRDNLADRLKKANVEREEKLSTASKLLGVA